MMKKIWIVLLVVSSVLAIPAMANPLEDSLQMATGNNHANIGVSPSSSNWVTNSIGQALTSMGPQSNNINDVMALSGAATGAAIADSKVNAPATSGNSGNTDNLLDNGDAKGVSVAKSEDNKATSDANGAEVGSGDAENHVDQKNKVDQDAYARIKNNQNTVQIVKIKDFQMVKADANPEVNFDNSILTENDTIMSGSQIQVE